LKGEDGSKAKKMTPGSYWTMPAKLEHVSSCAAGTDCVIFVWQKTKFDFAEVKVPGAGSAAKAEPPKAGSGAGSAAKVEPPKAGSGAGSAAPKK
jgi:hypothetical protein